MCTPALKTASAIMRALCGLVFCLVCGGPVCFVIGMILLFSSDPRGDLVSEYNNDVKRYYEHTYTAGDMLPAQVNGADAVAAAVVVAVVGSSEGVDPARSTRVVATGTVAPGGNISYNLHDAHPFTVENVTERKTLFTGAFCNSGYGCSTSQMHNWCVIQFGSGAVFVRGDDGRDGSGVATFTAALSSAAPATDGSAGEGKAQPAAPLACPERGLCGRCQYTAYLTDYCIAMRHVGRKHAHDGDEDGEPKELTGNSSISVTSSDAGTDTHPPMTMLTPPPSLTPSGTATTASTEPEGGGHGEPTKKELEDPHFEPSHRYRSCYYPFTAASQRFSSVRQPLYVSFSVLLESDPFIAMQRITEGTMNFGTSKAQQRTAGVALVAIGAAALAVSALLAVVLYRCYKNKRAKEKAHETRVSFSGVIGGAVGDMVPVAIPELGVGPANGGGRSKAKGKGKDRRRNGSGSYKTSAGRRNDRTAGGHQRRQGGASADSTSPSDATSSGQSDDESLRSANSEAYFSDPGDGSGARRFPPAHFGFTAGAHSTRHQRVESLPSPTGARHHFHVYTRSPLPPPPH